MKQENRYMNLFSLWFQAASKIKSGKVAAAAYGSVQKLPYIDTLLKWRSH